MSPKKIFAPAALLILMGLAPGVQAQTLNLYGVIDLSVGSMLAMCSAVMAMSQTQWLPAVLGLLRHRT